MVTRDLLAAHDFGVQTSDDSPKLNTIVISSSGKNEFLIQTSSNIFVRPRCEFAAKYTKIMSLFNKCNGFVVIGLNFPKSEVPIGIRGNEVGPVRSEFTTKDRVLRTSERPHQGPIH